MRPIFSEDGLSAKKSKNVVSGIYKRHIMWYNIKRKITFNSVRDTGKASKYRVDVCLVVFCDEAFLLTY